MHITESYSTEYACTWTESRCTERKTGGLDEPLLLEVFVCLPVVYIAFLIFKFFHGLLFEYLVSAFTFEFLGH